MVREATTGGCWFWSGGVGATAAGCCNRWWQGDFFLAAEVVVRAARPVNRVVLSTWLVMVEVGGACARSNFWGKEEGLNVRRRTKRIGGWFETGRCAPLSTVVHNIAWGYLDTFFNGKPCTLLHCIVQNGCNMDTPWQNKCTNSWPGTIIIMRLYLFNMGIMSGHIECFGFFWPNPR